MKPDALIREARRRARLYERENPMPFVGRVMTPPELLAWLNTHADRLSFRTLIILPAEHAATPMRGENRQTYDVTRYRVIYVDDDVDDAAPRFGGG